MANARHARGLVAKLCLPVAFLSMHAAWGIGFWQGLLRSPRGKGRVAEPMGTNSPQASFTAEPLNGTAPHAVRSADTSTGSPTTGSWSLGDGETAVDPNPEHLYGATSTTGRCSETSQSS
jgi:hypothetical protein